MERRLEQTQAKMEVLKRREAIGVEFSREARSRREQLAPEREELLVNSLFHTY